MKKNFLSIMAAGITVVLMLGSAGAQVAMNNSSDVRAGFTTANSADIKRGISAADVNFRVLKDFQKRFMTANNATWNETDKGYIARFSANSIETMVAYGKHGNWFYTIQRYNEKNLPADVRALVKSTYYDYTFFHIDEVNVPEQENSIYILLLQDNKHFKTVRVCGDEMEVINDYHN
jgi:hypothetical protein